MTYIDHTYGHMTYIDQEELGVQALLVGHRIRGTVQLNRQSSCRYLQ